MSGSLFMPGAFCALALMLLLAAAASAARAAENRETLWPVVRTCASAYRMIGVSFPCLKVDLPGGALDRGYAVLRPPNSNDLILSPTRKIVGVEDPFIQSPAAPNYFADAWRERTFLKAADGNPPPRDAV